MNLKRLDISLCERNLTPSRERAQALILAGVVWSEGRRLDKPGIRISPTCPLEIRSRSPRYVSRAGEKLSHALESFQLDVTKRVCLDIGASTGGFTDCLLQKGARKVFAVDVGYGQLDFKLRQSERVVVVEKTNARYLTLEKLQMLDNQAKEASLISMDVSFISLRKIIGPIRGEFPFLRDWVILFKPQFEVGQKYVKKGGVVKDEEIIRASLDAFNDFMHHEGFVLKNGPESSPVPGKKKGNIEYLIYYELH